jgi:tRNA 5-methylaminomethyl-2-thiouridine biosynthesis bifunctional protein
VTHALAARGWRVSLIERACAPAAEASGNSAGTFHPMFAREETPLTRLTRNAFLHGTAAWRAIESRGMRIAWQTCGALQLPGQRQGAAGIPHAGAWPPELVRNVDRAEACALTGVALQEGGLWFPGGGWMDPASLCQAQLQDAGDAVEAFFGATVARCEYSDGAWHALDNAGRRLASAPAIVFANASDAMHFLPQTAGSMRTVRGQVTLLPQSSLPRLAACVLGRAYMIPARDGHILCGTTYQPDDPGLDVRAADHDDNLRRCRAALEHGLTWPDPATLEGRAGIRAVTRDRLPMMGALGGHAWCATGFASRGILWGTLAGEVIAAQLEGEPAPLEAPLLRAVDPCRFARQPVD